LLIFVVWLVWPQKKDTDKTPLSGGEAGNAVATNTDVSTTPEVITGNAQNTGNTGNPLQTEAIPEVHTLIETYFNAMRAGNKEQLSSILDVIDDDVEANIAFDTQYIEAYENIVCYTQEGIEDGSYVVYAYCDIKFVNIDTLAPSISIMYVVQDAVSGNYYIHNGIGETEIAAYVEELTTSSDVVALFADVDAALTEACESDEALALFCQSLQANESGEIIVGVE